MQLRDHPFYRLPRGAAGAPLSSFNGNTAFSIPGEPSRLGEGLLSLRALLLKEELSEAEVKKVMSMAPSLLHFVSTWSPSQLEKLRPFDAINPVACRFLVVDALWSICSVVGPNMNQAEWWDRLMEHVAIPESLVSYPLFAGAANDWRPFLASARDALEVFRRGRRPSPEAVVALKREILCNPGFHRRFKGRLWEPWRKDDEDYRRKTGES